MLNIPDHWSFLLEDFGETESGDVITRDGEIIGTWGLVDGVFYTFTPEGAAEHIFFEPFLGEMCVKMREWLEERI